MLQLTVEVQQNDTVLRRKSKNQWLDFLILLFLNVSIQIDGKIDLYLSLDLDLRMALFVPERGIYNLWPNSEAKGYSLSDLTGFINTNYSTFSKAQSYTIDEDLSQHHNTK